MKSMIITFVTFLFFNLSSAQPVLTGLNSNPVAGDKFTTYDKFLHTTSVNEGSAGSSVTWDFSNITTQSISTTKDSTTFYSCSKFPGCNKFSSANIQSYTDGGLVVYFYTANNQKYSIDGYGNDTNSMTIYQPAITLLKYPFNYNDTFSYNMIDTIGTIEQISSVLTKYDGYGTIVMPKGNNNQNLGTYNNVVRVHARTTIFESSIFSSLTDTIYIDRYSWYVPNIHSSVFDIIQKEYHPTTGNIFTHYSYTYTLAYSSSTGMIENGFHEGNLTLYPNPTTGIFTVENISPHSSIDVYSITGQQLKAIKVNSNGVSVDISELSNGIYYLKMTDITGRQSYEKVLKN